MFNTIATVIVLVMGIVTGLTSNPDRFNKDK